MKPSREWQNKLYMCLWKFTLFLLALIQHHRVLYLLSLFRMYTSLFLPLSSLSSVSFPQHESPSQLALTHPPLYPQSPSHCPPKAVLQEDHHKALIPLATPTRAAARPAAEKSCYSLFQNISGHLCTSSGTNFWVLTLCLTRLKGHSRNVTKSKTRLSLNNPSPVQSIVAVLGPLGKSHMLLWYPDSCSTHYVADPTKLPSSADFWEEALFWKIHPYPGHRFRASL